jgi:hypothetical protein
MSKLIPVSELPPTRLELRWRPIERDENGYTWFCDYDLVLELDELDIRGEVYDDEHNLIERKREKRTARTFNGTASASGCQCSWCSRARP